MSRVIDSSCNWIRSHFPKGKVNKFSIVVIMIYYYVGLLSYITNPWWQIYRWFIASNPVSIAIRAFLTALLCLYALLIAIVNKEKIQWKWAIIFIYILLFTIVSTAISPQNYAYIYISKLYNIIHKVTVAPGWSRIFTMFFSSISDFAVAFCLLLIFPLVINNKKQILLLLMPIAFIGLLECFYSIIFERQEYVKLFQMIGGQYGGYEVNIGATFGNKQDWGAFATVAFASAIFSFVLIQDNVKKFIKVLLKTALLLASFILLLFTIMSLCKTAIISEIIMLSFFVIYLIVYLFEKNRPLSIVLIIFVSFLFVMFFMFLFVTQMHTLPVLNKLYTLIDTYFLQRISWSTLWGRTSIWYTTVNNLRTYNLFFGLSKAGVNAYSQIVNVDGQTTFHNGFAYFLMSYGVLGFSVYLIVLFIVIRRLFLCYKFNKGISLCLIGIFGCAFVFTLAESEVVIVSGSNPIFIFNVLLCTFSAGFYRKERTNEKAFF